MIITWVPHREYKNHADGSPIVELPVVRIPLIARNTASLCPRPRTDPYSDTMSVSPSGSRGTHLQLIRRKTGSVSIASDRARTTSSPRSRLSENGSPSMTKNGMDLPPWMMLFLLSDVMPMRVQLSLKKINCPGRRVNTRSGTITMASTTLWRESLRWRFTVSRFAL